MLKGTSFHFQKRVRLQVGTESFQLSARRGQIRSLVGLSHELNELNGLNSLNSFNPWLIPRGPEEPPEERLLPDLRFE
jgi:hypothetical protein